jgi:hypothetical protein
MYRRIAVFCLGFFLSITPEVTGQKKGESPSHLIRWTGSAYADADAFIVTARIFPSKVELNWNGFLGRSFEFMDEPGEAPPPRVQKEFTISDAATVQAFKDIAEHAEFCDPGESMVVGQGVVTETVVEMPPGKKVREMRFFHPEPYLTRATGLEKVPIEAKGFAMRNVGTEAAAEDTFCRYIRDFAADLSRFAACQRKLMEAYRDGAELPLEAMRAMRNALPLERAIQLLGGENEVPETLRKTLGVVETLLRDCLGPASRARFIEGGYGEGGIIVTVRKARASTGWSFPDLAPEAIAVDLGTPEGPLVRLPRELEDSIIFFVAGPAMAADEKARKLGINIADNLRLGLSKTGGLELKLSRQGEVWNELDHLGVDLDIAIKHPETRARMNYLNSKGIVRFLLGHEIPKGKVPALLRIEELNVSAKDFKRATIQFRGESGHRVAQIFLTDGRWTPGKIWEWEDFQESRSPFDADEFPDEPQEKPPTGGEDAKDPQSKSR